MTKSAQDFARDLTLIVDASAHALSALNLVLEQQQQSILTLASAGGVPAPNTVPPTSAARPAAAQAAPAAAASPEPAAPAALSPEALLVQAEKTAQALIDQSPELAIAQLYQASAHAVGIALLNAASAQQQLTILAQAVVTRGAANLLSAPAPQAPALAEKTANTAAPGALRAQPQRPRAR